MEHKLFLFLVAHSGIKDALIKKFRSFSELKNYAKCAPDPELLGKIKVCTTPLWLKGYSISYKILSLVRQWDTLFHEKPQQRGHFFTATSVLFYFALWLVQKTRATLNQSDTKLKINATQSRTFVQRLRQCAFTIEVTVVFVVFLFVLINKSNTVYSNGKQLHLSFTCCFRSSRHIMSCCRKG